MTVEYVDDAEGGLVMITFDGPPDDCALLNEVAGPTSATAQERSLRYEALLAKEWRRMRAHMNDEAEQGAGDTS